MVDPSGHAQACLDGDYGNECGSDGTITYIYSNMDNPNRAIKIPGWQIQVTFAAAVNTSGGDISRTVNGKEEKISPAIFYGVSMVNDETGFQIYSLERDISWDPRLVQGTAELENATDLTSFGLTIATGPIFGEGMKVENGGADNYSGEAIDHIYGAGPISVDYYAATDPDTGKPNPDWLSGFDIGYSWGSPSWGKIATKAVPWFRNRIQMLPNE